MESRSEDKENPSQISLQRQISFYGIEPWSRDPLEPDSDSSNEDQGQIQLSEGWIRKAHDELQEKSQWRVRDIEALRQLVKAEQNLKCPTDDKFLLKFLRAQKFDYDKTLSMMKRYFSMRKRYPQNFTKALPSLAEPIFKAKQQTVLAHRDQHGRRIFLFRAGANWDPCKVSPSDIFAANYLLLETCARETKTQIAGLAVIVDMSGFGFNHLMHISTDYVKSVAAVIQSTFPLRFREIHIINESYLFDLAFQLIKPFLSETIRSRITFHGSDLTQLHSHFNPDILPTEFGGNSGSMDNTELVDVLKSSENYFKDLCSYGILEDQDDSVGSGCQGGSTSASNSASHHPFVQSYCLMGANLEEE